MATILTVDDELGIREFLADTLTGAGHQVLQAASGRAGLEQLADRPIDLAIVDFRMPGEIDGMEVVRRIRAERPETQVILLTAHGTVGMAVEAMRLGAFDFLEKPLAGPDELRRLVSRALNWRGVARPALPSATGRGDGDAPRRGDREPTPQGLLVRLSREMKRRHVYNVAATYAAIAFIALQAAELILPVMPMVPVWGYQALVALAAGGFPAALALGWIFDIKVSRTDRARMLDA